MKRFVFILIVLLRITRADAQADIGSAFVNDNYADSLIRQVQQSKDDTNKVKLYIALGDYYTFIRQDSSIFYFVQSIELAEKINFAIGSYSGYAKLAFVLNTASNYGKALEMALKSLRIAEKFQHNRQENMARSYNLMGLINRRNGYDTVARDQCRQSIRLYEEAGITIGGGRMNFGPFLNLAIVYLKWKNWDFAFYSQKIAMISWSTIHPGRRRRCQWLHRPLRMFMSGQARFNWQGNTTSAELKAIRNSMCLCLESDSLIITRSFLKIPANWIPVYTTQKWL